MKSENNHYKIFDNNSDIGDRFLQLFVNRADTYATQKEDGSYIRVEAALTKDVLKRHFTGEITVGAYLVNPMDQTTKTLPFDVDPEHVKDPRDVASKILKSCSGRFPEKAVLLEASRHPDPSFHIWVFFEPPIPAKAARFLGRKILEHAGVVVELFPKQDEVKPGEFGNLVKLPLGLLRISQFLGLTLVDFHVRYVETDGEKFYFKHTRPCKFLKDNRCVIYPVRPTVCRYYPFTDEPGVLFFEPECNVPVEMVALKALGLLIRSKLPPKVCLAMDMLSKQVLKEAEKRGFEKDSLETAMYIYARWMELLNRKTMGERRK